MFESIGSYLDKTIPVLAGLFLVFIYPRMSKIRIDKIEDAKKKEKELKRNKVLGYVGLGLILGGIIGIIMI
jgi:ACR3 family arsenite efflux pump ArsB